jgi:hypothetical protein
VQKQFKNGMTKNQDQIQNTPADFLSIGRRSLPKAEPKRNTVEIVDSGFKTTSWDDRSLRSKSVLEKPVEEWNKRDQVSYFSYAYRQKYGTLHVWGSQYQANYMVLADVHHALYHQLKLDTDCSPHIFKDYVDFFFLRFADSLIAQKNYRLTFTDIKKQKYIGAFVAQYKGVVRSSPKPTEVKVESSLKDELNTAYDIHAQFFITNYGLILPANYLVNVVGKSISDAKGYIERAYDKLKKSEKDMVDKATANYGPYPKWFKITEFREQNIVVCDDNPVYAFLRSI